MTRLKLYLQIYSLPISILFVGCFLYFFVFDSFEYRNTILLLNNAILESDYKEMSADQAFMYEELKKNKNKESLESFSYLVLGKKDSIPFVTINPNYLKQQYSANIQFDTISPSQPNTERTSHKKTLSRKSMLNRQAINHPYQFINTHNIRPENTDIDYFFASSTNLARNKFTNRKKQWAITRLKTTFVRKNRNLSSKAVCTLMSNHKLPILDMDNTWVFVQCQTKQKHYASGYIEKRLVKIVTQ